MTTDQKNAEAVIAMQEKIDRLEKANRDFLATLKRVTVYIAKHPSKDFTTGLKLLQDVQALIP